VAYWDNMFSMIFLKYRFLIVGGELNFSLVRAEIHGLTKNVDVRV
jgi:hypothetical protein